MLTSERFRFRETKSDNMTTILNLNAQHVAALRELVNAKQDALFNKLQTLVKEDDSTYRQNGVRSSLRFWDEIDIALRDAKMPCAQSSADEEDES